MKGGLKMKRTKLSERNLPLYSRGEEIMNMVTHIVGGGIGIIALLLCLTKTIYTGNILGIVSSAIYGSALICLYAVSSIYHGLLPCIGKKVMQVIDHCTIYFLIAGTYTPILLCAVMPIYKTLAILLLAFQWGLGALAITLTAIDLKKYNAFSMVCYIIMGWAIIFFLPQAITALTMTGFYLLLAGGIAYTVGAILYGVGVKVRWMHSVFHIFVVLGSFFQFLSVLLYAL